MNNNFDTSNLIVINDSYSNISKNLNFNQIYIIYLQEHNIKLNARLYYIAKMGTKLDFMVIDKLGNDLYGLGYDKRDFQHIEYFKWDKFEDCQIYMNK